MVNTMITAVILVVNVKMFTWQDMEPPRIEQVVGNTNIFSIKPN
jgi:hypothetical protein